MSIGATSILAWPIIDAACSVPVPWAGTDPRKAGKPRSRSTPIPRAAAALLRAAWDPLPLLEMLHELANAVRKGICPRLSTG